MKTICKCAAVCSQGLGIRAQVVSGMPYRVFWVPVMHHTHLHDSAYRVMKGLQAKMNQEEHEGEDLPRPKLHLAVRVDDEDHTRQQELAQQVDALIVPRHIVTVAPSQHMYQPPSQGFIGALP